MALGVVRLATLVHMSELCDKPADQAAEGARYHCFREHLSEAITLNRHRLRRYAHLSAGRSVPISLILMSTEVMALPIASVFDRRARPYHDAGVLVMQDLFVSMSLSPAFNEEFELPPPPRSAYEKPDASALIGALRFAHKEGGFDGLRFCVADELNKLESAQHYHCMLRHLLESIGRIAYFAPVHKKMSVERGLNYAGDVTNLHLGLLKTHLMTIRTGIHIDKMCVPLHAKGLPIVFQDVPPILHDIDLAASAPTHPGVH